MKKQLLYICVLAFLVLSGCKKLVEVDLPKDRLVTQKVFETNETSISAIGGLYASMMSDNNFPLPYNIALYCGLYTDELELKTTDVPRSSVYKNALIARDAPTNSIWSKGYYFIYQANNIIHGLENSTGVTETVKKQLVGESYFIRAFWHFYLVNLYGDIPLVTTTDYTVNGVMPRTSSTVVYHQIIADLIKAKSLVSDKYIGANAITEVTDRVRPNRYSVSALLSRVYLYSQNWNGAEDEATIVINNTANYTLEPIANVFKVASKEAIWQLQMPTNSAGTTLKANTYEGNFFVLIAAPSTSNSGSVIRSSLYNLFDSNDQRRNNWMATYTSTTPTILNYIHPAKYKLRTLGAAISERSAVFRLGELYLIRAEARAQRNNLSGAIADLDAIRGRAGISLTSVTNPNITKDDLLTAISQERQRELFCEWGHRWLDLKRNMEVNEVMNIVTPQKGGVWSPNKVLWPIPLNDITNNPFLVQNPGYN